MKRVSEEERLRSRADPALLAIMRFVSYYKYLWIDAMEAAPEHDPLFDQDALNPDVDQRANDRAAAVLRSCFVTGLEQGLLDARKADQALTAALKALRDRPMAVSPAQREDDPSVPAIDRHADLAPERSLAVDLDAVYCEVHQYLGRIVQAETGKWDAHPSPKALQDAGPVVARVIADARFVSDRWDPAVLRVLGESICAAAATLNQRRRDRTPGGE